jgi:hypothetical protein
MYGIDHYEFSLFWPTVARDLIGAQDFGKVLAMMYYNLSNSSEEERVILVSPSVGEFGVIGVWDILCKRIARRGDLGLILQCCTARRQD